MASKGGARPGAGRPKGARNRRTIAKLRLAQGLLEGDEITPLELMVSRMRELFHRGDEESLREACSLAKDCAPYLHPRLNATELHTDN
jgi:hypothetical protein